MQLVQRYYLEAANIGNTRMTTNETRTDSLVLNKYTLWSQIVGGDENYMYKACRNIFFCF